MNQSIFYIDNNEILSLSFQVELAKIENYL